MYEWGGPPVAQQLISFSEKPKTLIHAHCLYPCSVWDHRLPPERFFEAHQSPWKNFNYATHSKPRKVAKTLSLWDLWSPTRLDALIAFLSQKHIPGFGKPSEENIENWHRVSYCWLVFVFQERIVLDRAQHFKRGRSLGECVVMERRHLAHLFSFDSLLAFSTNKQDSPSLFTTFFRFSAKNLSFFPYKRISPRLTLALMRLRAPQMTENCPESLFQTPPIRNLRTKSDKIQVSVVGGSGQILYCNTI